MPSAATILALSAKVLVLVALGALLARVLRRASAACRHVLWTAVLGGVLVLALTTPVRPPWSLPIGFSATLLSVPELETGGRGSVELHLHSPVPPGSRSALEAVTSASRRGQVLRGLAWVWTLGVVLFTLRLAAGRLALSRARRRSRALVSGGASTLLDELRARHVPLAETEERAVPAPWGVR